MSVDAFIEAEQARHGSVTRVCRLFEVSRSAYYTRRRGPSPRQYADAALTERILAVHEASGGSYGSPRIQAELHDQGHRHGRKRIARLLAAAGRRGRAPKRWRTTTVPDPAAVLPQDLIGRAFAPVAGQHDRRWCGDITYIRTWEGWLYLATVIDLDTRRVVGWATADHLRTELVAQALQTAVATRRPNPGVIFHSDYAEPCVKPRDRGMACVGGVALSDFSA